MAEVIAAAGKARQRRHPRPRPLARAQLEEAQHKNIATPGTGSSRSGISSGYPDEVSSLNVPSKPGANGSADPSLDRSGPSERATLPGEAESTVFLDNFRVELAVWWYRFCRTDDVWLFVDALITAGRRPFQTGWRRGTRSSDRSHDLQVWSSGSMVRLTPPDPIARLDRRGTAFALSSTRIAASFPIIPERVTAVTCSPRWCRSYSIRPRN